MVRHRDFVSALVMTTLLLVTGARGAAAQGLGPEFQANTFTTGHQYSPAVAADGAGNFVVVWESAGQDGSLQGVFGQRFDSEGNAAGSEFQVNSYTTGDQRYPAVAMDDAGNFLVVWTDDVGHDLSLDGVFGQLYDFAGVKVGGEFQVNSYTTADQAHAAVAADGAGNFVVAWQSDQDGHYEGIFARRYDSAGAAVGSEFQVNTYTTKRQLYPAVAADSVGNFVVVWENSAYQDGSSFGVFGQRFDSAGDKSGSEFQINSYTTSYQAHPAVAADPAGNFVVVWASHNQDGDSLGVFGQRFDSSGGEVGSEFQVNSYTTGSQRYPAVAMDDAGNFVVAWESSFQESYLDPSGVFGQLYDAAGNRVADEFLINAYTSFAAQRRAAVSNSARAFVVAWQSSGQDASGHGIFGRRMTPLVSADGFESGDVCGWSSQIGSGDVCDP